MPVTRMAVVPLRQLPLGIGRNIIRKLPLGQDPTDDGTDIALPTTGFDTSSISDLGPQAPIYYAPPDLSSPSPSASSIADASLNPQAPQLSLQEQGLVPASVLPGSYAQPSSFAQALTSVSNLIKPLTSLATPSRPTPTTINTGVSSSGSQSIASAVSWFEKSSMVSGIPNWATIAGIVIGGAAIMGGIKRMTR